MSGKHNILWAWVLAAAGAFGADRGDVAGLGQDTSGAVLVSASVTMMDETTGIRRTARTDEEGVYYIPALPAGLYRVTVRKPGFQTVVRLNAKVDAGADLRLDFAMRVGNVKEVITVEGSPPVTNSADASVGTLVGRKAIEALPSNGRGVLSLIELTPGIVATPASGGEAGQFSTDGLRSNTNYFTIDGLSANTGISGAGLPAQFPGAALPAMTAFGSMQNLASMESLDEIRILSSSFAPEYGRLPGAQVALKTRSGSDEFHGSVSGSLRNQALNANDWFANAYGLALPSRMREWGAVLGGPMLRARTYFFASYEALRLRGANSWMMAAPSPDVRVSAPAPVQPLLNAYPLPLRDVGGVGAVAVTRPSRLDSGSLRIDHSLTDRVSLFGRYNRAPSSTKSGFPQVEHLELGRSSLSLGATVMASPTVMNDVRLSVWSVTAGSRWSSGQGGLAGPIDLAKILRLPPGPGPAFYAAAIGGVGPLLEGTSGRNRQREWNGVETLVVNRPSHAWRLGVDYERLLPVRESAAVALAGTWPSLADVLTERPPTLVSTVAEQASSLIETLSVFAQDTYRPSRRLSLTYGLRWELTPPPSVREPGAALTANGTNTGSAGSAPPASPSFGAPVASPNLPLASTNQALWTTSYTQLAPRIGAAFRLDENSVVRAGWGLFYDVGFGVALDPLNGFPFNRWQFTVAGTVAGTGNTGPFGARVAPNLRLPYVAEWNVAYERALNSRNIMSVSYVGSSGRRLLRREGVLAPGSMMAEYQAATNNGDSHYNGLQVQYRRRMGGKLQGTVSYTWAHSIDNGSVDSGIYFAELPAGSDRGSSSFDVRHSFTAGLTFTPRWSGPLLRDWELSGMLRARSGFPIDVVAAENLLGLGFDDTGRPDVVPGVPLWLSDDAIGGRRLNPAAFLPPTGIQGSLGRNTITGFGMAQLDAALDRVAPLSRRLNLHLRLEAYNLFNHPSPADPVRFLNSALFGRSPSMLNLMLGTGTARSGIAPAFQIGGPRSLELKLRLEF